MTARHRHADRLLAGAALLLVLALVLFEGVQMTRGQIAYGAHPAALAGRWVGRDARGGTWTLTLDASGRFTDQREPDAGDDRRGHWGTFPVEGRPGVTRLCLRAPDGAFERCVERSASAAALTHPYRDLALVRARDERR